MTVTLFSSMGLAVCGLIFVFLISVMYMSKKKYDGVENAVYRFLLVVTNMTLILEIAFACTMEYSNSAILKEVMARGYLLFSIFWATGLCMYMISLRTTNFFKKNTKKYGNMIIALTAIIDTILFTISCFLDVTYYGGNGNLYVIGGPTVYVLYFLSVVMILIILSILLTKKSKIPQHQKTPFYFIFVAFFVITAVQFLLNYDFNDLSFIFAFSVIAMYFTTESQDNKLISDLSEAKEKSLRINKLKIDFLSNMSHEIRTPMNTILGFSTSLLNKENLTQEDVINDMKSINEEGVNLLELINNILDISRVESGKEVLDEKNYNLRHLVFDVDSVIMSKINKNILTFNINIDENLPKTLYGDYSKLYKSVVLIIKNAINYTSYGKISLDITGVTEKDVCNLEIVVSNTGHAMKIEDFEKGFSEFVKLGSAAENSIDSVTLGLIIAKRLLDIIGANIEFKNETGKGTRYIISLKQKVIDNEKLGNIYEQKQEVIVYKDLSSKNILIVDDNDINIKLAVKLLSKYKFNIESTNSGEECIKLVKDKKYDMIFLDHMMPEMDGIATMKILSSSGYNVPPVIALTANSYEGLKDVYIKEGFSDYLSKPINPKQLDKIINHYFNDNGRE